MYNEYESLRFKKTGKQIIDKIAEKEKENDERQARKQKELDEVCGKYKITTQNLLNNLDHFLGISNSAEMPSEEMTKLKKLAADIERCKDQRKTINRIKAHLDPDRQFDLKWDELCKLGFE